MKRTLHRYRSLHSMTHMPFESVQQLELARLIFFDFFPCAFLLVNEDVTHAIYTYVFVFFVLV